MSNRSEKMLAGQSARERALADRSTTVRRASPAQLSKLSLTPEEGFVVSRVDHPMPISEVLSVSGLPEAHALQVLLNLMTKGALLLPGEGAAEEQAAPAPSSPRAAYEDFVFNPRDLNEDIDLDLDRKKQILFLYNRMDNISHYRLLGITPDATEADIRKAFLEKSRLFHSDTYFRKRLGSYKDKLDALFQRVKEAHDTLMDTNARRKYEWEARRLFTPEEVSFLVQREIDSIEDERRQKTRREQLLRSRGFAKLTKARDALAEGEALLAQGKATEAIQRFQTAMELDPRLELARQKLTEARKLAVTQRAELAIAESDRAEQEGNNARAVELLKSALELDNTNPRTYRALAALLLRSGGDLKEARSHAQRAITLGDKSGAARLLQGEILLRLGLKKPARAEFEAAAELGEAAQAEALLKQC